jgi:type IV pilus assembly protein PilM
MKFSFSGLFQGGGARTKLPQSVVGIDIGSGAIKVVEVELRNDMRVLKTYGELQLGPYGNTGLGNVVELDERKKTEALTDVMREAGVNAKTGVLSLPLASSFVTIMSLTAKPEENIEPRVRVEARKYIPIPLQDVTLDWTELAPLGKNPDNVREVLIVAVQNDAYGQMTNIMQTVQKFSQPSEIELFSTLRSLDKSTDTSLAVLDLGAGTSKLYIAHEGMLRKIHRVRIGGAQATVRLGELIGGTFEENENRKRSYTPDSERAADIKRAVVSTFERPFQEFQRVLAQHEMKVGAPVSRVVLSGGSAIFPELLPFASYMFDRTVERANPFANVAYPAFMEQQLTTIAPTFSVAIGAALRPYEV